MKKLFAVIMALVLSASVFCGCDSDSKSKKKKDKDDDSIEQQFNDFQDMYDDYDDEYGDDDYDDYDDDYQPSNLLDQEAVPLSSGYPENVVPIYSDGKIISSSCPPSETLYVVEIVMELNQYKDAVKFYKNAFPSIEAESFKSDIMESESFKGKIDDWKFDVTVMTSKAMGLSSIVIAMQME